MAKTNKSILKRVRITKTGKILSSGVGFNHFQAKKTRSSQMKKKRWGAMEKTQARKVQSYLKH